VAFIEDQTCAVSMGFAGCKAFLNVRKSKKEECTQDGKAKNRGVLHCSLRDG
jgi:hypothetical protein